MKNNTKKWVDILQNVVNDYNRTPHSAHGLPPLDVSSKNRDEVYNKLYPDVKLKTVCRLATGDKVRKIIEKDLFQKGYSANWSEQIYIISKVRQSDGVCWYYLEDLDGNKLKGKTIHVTFKTTFFRYLVLLSIESCRKTC